ncbi:hypothetical protein GBA52_024640 [Prunus armeniaca]|nr:hypothetical protein GBA52_024640 [Prunus armeniaca]
MEKSILSIKEEIFLSFVFSLAAADTWFQLQIEKLQTTNTLKQTETIEERERDSHGSSRFSIRTLKTHLAMEGSWRWRLCNFLLRPITQDMVPLTEKSRTSKHA